MHAGSLDVSRNYLVDRVCRLDTSKMESDGVNFAGRFLRIITQNKSQLEKAFASSSCVFLLRRISFSQLRVSYTRKKKKKEKRKNTNLYQNLIFTTVSKNIETIEIKIQRNFVRNSSLRVFSSVFKDVGINFGEI